MVENLLDQIETETDTASRLYHRLVLVVGPRGAGKTAALNQISQKTGTSLINVNLELSQRMLELTERQRFLQLSRLLSDIVIEASNELVLLDNIEILFDINLKQNPLHLLQVLSRNKTIVVAWNGAIVKGQLTYAEPSHLEYRRYPAEDIRGIIIIDMVNF